MSTQIANKLCTFFITLLILFVSAACGSQTTLDPPDGSSGDEIPLYPNAQKLSVNEADIAIFIADTVGSQSSLYSSRTDISWTEDPGSEVQKQLDELLPESNWRVESDWSGIDQLSVSEWRNGDLHVVILYFDNLDSEQIDDLKRRYGISDLQPGSTLIVTHLWDTTQLIPSATPTETPIPTSTPLPTVTPLPSATPLPPTGTPTATPLPPTPTPTATLAPGSLLFEDDFNDGNANGWLPVLPSWNVVDAEYICVSNDGRTFAGENFWTDYTITADLRPLSGSRIDVGVLGRLQDEEHFYMAQLFRGDLARLFRRDSGNWVELTSVPYASEYGISYEVSLEFQGTTINMYVNEVLVTSTEDATYLSGKIGLRCASDGQQAYFDNVTVKLP